jgi:hypothetical protein
MRCSMAATCSAMLCSTVPNGGAGTQQMLEKTAKELRQLNQLLQANTHARTHAHTHART